MDLEAGTATGTWSGRDFSYVISNFESIRGGRSSDDTLRGSAGNERLEGRGGNDIIEGRDGHDSLNGDDGDDSIEGGAGDDEIFGDDEVWGGAGADRLDGGSEVDTLFYESSDAAVSVNLATRMVSGGFAEGDTISNFEEVAGSVHDDTLVGDSGDNSSVGLEATTFLRAARVPTILSMCTPRSLTPIRQTATPDTDTITDFTDGEDLINLSNLTDFGLSGFSDVDARSVSQGVTIDLTNHGGGSILLMGFDLANLDESDFIF